MSQKDIPALESNNQGIHHQSHKPCKATSHKVREGSSVIGNKRSQYHGSLILQFPRFSKRVTQESEQFAPDSCHVKEKWKSISTSAVVQGGGTPRCHLDGVGVCRNVHDFCSIVLR